MTRQMASHVGGQEMTPDHLLLALLSMQDAGVERILNLSCGRETLYRTLKNHCGTATVVAPSVDMQMSRALRAVIKAARKESKLHSNEAVEPIHLLLGLLRTEATFATRLLAENGVTYNTAVPLIAEP